MILKPWLVAGFATLTVAATACASSTPTASSVGQDTVSSSPATADASSSAPATAGPTVGASGGGIYLKDLGGFTIGSATDLATAPKVSGKGSHTPTVLEVKDLVVGTGAAANPTSTVTVQYLGFRVADGGAFDSSWSRGQAATFPLTGVVPGFTQGIGGTGTIAPMKIGGRRLMLLPAELGYGAQGAGSDIPPNAAIAFIVDLTAVQ